MNFRLNISVSRATVQRIFKDRDRIISVPEKYRPSWSHKVNPIQHDFETELYAEFIRLLEKVKKIFEKIDPYAEKYFFFCIIHGKIP